MSQNISTGIQLHCPNGYGQLEQNRIYYFLRSYEVRVGQPLVRLVYFDYPQKKDGDMTKFITIRRDIFEEGLLHQHIVVCEIQRMLPEQLANFEGVNLELRDEKRVIAMKSHKERITEKLNVILPLTKDLDQLCASPNMNRAINAYVREKHPSLNPARVRTWFFTYLLFGRNPLVLHYKISNIGKWNRLNKQGSSKLGRPSPRKGKGAGFNVDEQMLAKIKKGYQRESRLGVNMRVIYRHCIKTDFSCTQQRDSRGFMRWINPIGDPYPSFGQFSYHVKKEFGQLRVYKNLYGKNNARTKYEMHQGSFSSSVCNLYERVEADAYSVVEFPRGLIEGSTLPRLVVARIIDLASSLLIGIGFSQGGETATAYRLAYFCAAIPKAKFFQIMGIDGIDPELWPSQGLPQFAIKDRGPGSAKDAHGDSFELGPTIKEITPSYSPQSKASIETSNPKTLENKDAPSYLKSNLTTIEVCRRETIRTVIDNDRIDVGGKVPFDLIGQIIKPTPLSLHNELSKRGRSDAMQISFDDAVRNFLTKCKATLTKEGVYLNSQLYTSAALKQTEMLLRNGHLKHVEVTVFVYDVAVRHIWIEIDGKICELDLTVRLRTNSGDLYRSLSELQQREVYLNEASLEISEHRHALEANMEQTFKEITGKGWRSHSRMKGRPQRGTPLAKQEARETARMANRKTRK